MLVVAEDKFKLDDEVIVLNGPYSGEKGKVIGSHYREADDQWMVTVQLDDTDLRYGASLTLSDDRIQLVSSSPRTAGSEISLGDVVVGDEVRVEYMLDDVVFARTGVVASIANTAYTGGIVLNSAKNVSIYRANWGHAKTVTLLTPNKVHPLEGVGIGTHFTVIPEERANSTEYRFVKYSDDFWIEEIRQDSQIVGLTTHPEDEVREFYLKSGKFLEKKTA